MAGAGTLGEGLLSSLRRGEFQLCFGTCSADISWDVCIYHRGSGSCGGRTLADGGKNRQANPRRFELGSFGPPNARRSTIHTSSMFVERKALQLRLGGM